MTLDNIFDFIKKHKDVIFMFDFLAGYIDRDNRKLMQDFSCKFKDADIIERSFIETYSIKNMSYLYEAGFYNIIPWIDTIENSEIGFKSITDIINILKKYNIKNVSVNPIRIINNQKDIKTLKMNGVRIFSPGWNSKKDLKKAQKLGIDIITTDLAIN